MNFIKNMNLRKKCNKLAVIMAMVLMSGSIMTTALVTTKMTTEAAGTTSNIPFENREYKTFDDSHLLKTLDEMEQLLTEENVWDDFYAGYQIVVEEINLMNTEYALLEIKYYQDVNDENLAAEESKASMNLTKIYDEVYRTLKLVLDSAYGDLLREYMTEGVVEDIEEYRELTDDDLALQEQENDLVQQYNNTMLKEYKVTFKGEEWTNSRLDGDDGAALSDEDYMTVFTELMKLLNQDAGEIYRQLVTIRSEQANREGFDNYADYMYDVYDRDYTTTDIRTIYDEVRSAIVPLRNRVQMAVYAQELDDLYAFNPGDEEDIWDNIQPVMGKISPRLEENMEYMRANHLYDNTTSDKKMDMGFTTELYTYGDAFIFNSPYGYYQDDMDMIHEFGHFNAALMDTTDALNALSPLDVAEIQSQGLELLSLEYADELFDKGAESLYLVELSNILSVIIDGCLYDEFQYEVYKEKDLSLVEMNQLFRRLAESYGVVYQNDSDEAYSWVQVSHTFQSPQYYISYATSGLSAFDILDQSFADRKAAVAKYMEIAELGGTTTYRAAIADSGLRNFFVPGQVTELAEDLEKRLTDQGRLLTENGEGSILEGYFRGWRILQNDRQNVMFKMLAIGIGLYLVAGLMSLALELLTRIKNKKSNKNENEA
ncbi:MAG: hypothetical protein PHP50_13745 [Lachnospiraceae bacterium]|nr:hypothetical protein [Lachnospiraceae bacterium]